MDGKRKIAVGVLGLISLGLTLTTVAQQARSTAPRGEMSATRPAGSVASTTPATPAAAPRRAAGGANVQTNHVSLEIVAPPGASYGTPADYEFIVRNVGKSAVENVRVEAALPRGAEFVSAEPAADVEADTASWTFDRLDAGRERTITMKLKPMSEGTLECHAMLTCMAITTAQTVVTRPMLELDMAGPREVVAGQPAKFVLKLSNPGTGPATNVIVRNLVPKGFEHPAGDEIEYEVGTLKPGDSRDVTLELIPKMAGEHTNHAEVTADGDLSDEAEVTLRVLKPQLAVNISGKKKRYLEQPVAYSIEVSNPGDAKATRVVLQQEIPAGVTLADATDGGRLSQDKRSVRWNFDELPPGDARTVTITLRPSQPGEVVTQAVASADGGLTAEADAATMVEAVTTLQLEVVDLTDPIETGAETTYEIRVVNRGSQAATNVVVQAIAPKGMKPTKAKGPDKCNHEISGQEVVFEPIPRLAARAEAAYHIQVRADRAGSMRFSVSVYCDELDSSVTKEENTRVYADE